MQIVSSGISLHEMSDSVFWENKITISVCRLLNIPSMLSVQMQQLQVWISEVQRFNKK